MYHEERVSGHIKKLYLVLENIEISKKCKPSPPYLVQVRIEYIIRLHYTIIIITVSHGLGHKLVYDFMIFIAIHFLKAGMDLTHLNLVMSTLAQFHAVSFAWKQSLGDDSILDMYPFLSKPPCPNIPPGDGLEL